MKTVIREHPLPRVWKTHRACDAVFEADVRPYRRSRLAAKVLVFKNKRGLRVFWKSALGHDLGPDCDGAVNGLGCDVENPSLGTRWQEVDKNYFCVIGFALNTLGTTVLTHEAAHAGFAYAKRVGTRGMKGEGNPYEESVCYPAGSIAAKINDLFYKRGVYDMREAKKRKRK